MNAKQLLESRKRGLLDKTDVVNLSDALLAIEINTLEQTVLVLNACHNTEAAKTYEMKLKELKQKNGIEI